ncbi:hypothetical protein HJG53_08015 [Sphingomonas sp. ID1715]|uniref:winged helix-turn-helix domain-containing protein n=1 Tax=Sphingomonas sp. ID1715 TaxID=1656898 RepID=UPI00148870CF|nr:winged helix-turn-helix domain-containing protein [Sphingomonas sp. ID1715]NNM76841.1 hypothetical protein [Sphingomonas sp. ID1715]
MEHRSFADDLLRQGFLGRFLNAARRPAELAYRPELAVGPVRIRPALRRLEGPASAVTVEPRVMQVLVTLAEAGGEVVTREQLNAICWNGQVVGDDALNRAVGEARRALKQAGAEGGIETIPKIGYRLDAPLVATPAVSRDWTRRGLVAGGAAALAGAGAWLATRKPARDPQVQALLDRARQALRDQYPDGDEQGAGFLRQAIARAPDDAEAWGMLSIAQRNMAEYAPVEQIDAATAKCQQSARRALALEPHQPDAEAALATLPPIYGDWLSAERRLQPVLDRHADQLDALAAMGILMISVGRIRDGARYVIRAAGLDPLSPIFQYRRAYHQWFLGDLPAADRTIDRGLQLWPRHPAIWYARMHIFGLTGRPDAALRMLATPEAERMMGAGAELWRTTMQALKTPALRGRAIAANLAAARYGGGGAVNAVLLFSALGEIDYVFQVTDAYLLFRGPLLNPSAPAAPGQSVNDQRFKKTMMLFNPVVAPARADPRFAQLCRDMGLERYWREAGVTPDHLLPR